MAYLGPQCAGYLPLNWNEPRLSNPENTVGTRRFPCPLSYADGAFLALFLTQTALSMPSMIGLIMLMGIATKNSILLIDYVILARREHGLDRWHALLDACRKRAGPIVMTTLAMGAGMMPVALGIGTDPSFRSPMAIVVIGGLITWTFLSLLVVPAVFSYVDDLIVFIRSGR